MLILEFQLDKEDKLFRQLVNVRVLSYPRRRTNLDLLADLQSESSGMFDLEKQDGEKDVFSFSEACVIKIHTLSDRFFPLRSESNLRQDYSSSFRASRRLLL